MPNEDRNAWIDFDWLRDIAEKVDAKGKKERLKNAANEAAETFKVYYDSFVSVGFTDEQAMELLMELFTLNK